MKITPPNPNIKTLKSAQNAPAEAFAFPLLCGYHAYDDYKKEEHNKKQVFFTNLFVLAGTSLGALVGYKTFGKILSKNTKIDQIKKDTIESIGAPLGGLIGGFGFSTIDSIYFEYKDQQTKIKNPQPSTKPKPQEPPKTTPPRQIETAKNQPIPPPKKEHKLLKQIGIITATIAGAVIGNRASLAALQAKSLKEAKLTPITQSSMNVASIGLGAITGLVAADRLINKKESMDRKAFESMDMLLTEVTPNVSSFDAMKERNLQSRIQKSFYEIISGIVVPSAIVLPTLFFVRNKLQDDKVLDNQLKFMKKITENKSTQRILAEKAVTMPLAIATYFIGDKVGQLFDQKVTQRILDQEFFDELEEKKQEAFLASKEGIKNNDREKVEKALEEIERYEEIQKKLRKSKEKSKKKLKLDAKEPG